MDKAEQTMIDNLKKNTGKGLEEWIKIVGKQKFEKHGQIVSYLKKEHDFTHGFANMVALKARKADAGSADDKDLIEEQYQGKEHFKPLYDKLINEIMKFGKDIEVSPKKSYVSVRRKKQFAMLQPASKTRFEIGINMKGQKPEGILEAVNKANSMCSHKINLQTEKDISKEVIDWLKEAYNRAG